MKELAKIANEVFLLPIRITNDRSSFEEGFQCQWATKVDSAVSDLKKMITNHPFPSKEELMVKGRDILQLLILCGEHSICAEWNTQELVDNVKNLLDLVLSKLGTESICGVFSCGGVAYSVLQQLKPKLGKTKIKAHPAAVNCFVWVISNTMVLIFDTSACSE